MFRLVPNTAHFVSKAALCFVWLTPWGTAPQTQPSVPGGFRWDGDLACVSLLDGIQHNGASVQTEAVPEEESTWVASQEAAPRSQLCQAFLVAGSTYMALLLPCKIATAIPSVSSAHFM